MLPERSRTMNEELIRYAGAGRRPAIPHRDYTMALLQHAAETGCIPQETLHSLRDGLHIAASDRARSFTGGLSGTVSREQAQAFYQSLFCQLDAVLLEAGSDDTALQMLRELPLQKLLDGGQMIMFRCYEEAKDAFRRAFRMAGHYQTYFFHSLLTGFSQFAAHYDARYDAARTYVDFAYPMLSGREPEETGVLGVHRYYTGLLRESELLARFDETSLREMLRGYAAKYLTSADQIAENLAELALLHWFTAVLGGGEMRFSADVTAEQAARMQERFCYSKPEDLEQAMRKVLEKALPDAPEIAAYAADALPALTIRLHSRITADQLGILLVIKDSRSAG